MDIDLFNAKVLMYQAKLKLYQAQVDLYIARLAGMVDHILLRVTMNVPIEDWQQMCNELILQGGVYITPLYQGAPAFPPKKVPCTVDDKGITLGKCVFTTTSGVTKVDRMRMSLDPQGEQLVYYKVLEPTIELVSASNLKFEGLLTIGDIS